MFFNVHNGTYTCVYLGDSCRLSVFPGKLRLLINFVPGRLRKDDDEHPRRGSEGLPSPKGWRFRKLEALAVAVSCFEMLKSLL